MNPPQLMHWTVGFWASGAFVAWKVASYLQLPQLVLGGLQAMHDFVELVDAI